MNRDRVQTSAVLFFCLFSVGLVSANPAVQSAVSKSTGAKVMNKGAASQPLPLSEEQLMLANHVATGNLPCELAQQVSVQAHASWRGHFEVQAGKQRFLMVPVPTSTGAVRLEDSVRGIVWLQLANKSMLMDQRQGRRLADACVSPAQEAVALAMERNPGPHLLDPQSSGSGPAGGAMK
jgi:hypothetical protein